MGDSFELGSSPPLRAASPILEKSPTPVRSVTPAGKKEISPEIEVSHESVKEESGGETTKREKIPFPSESQMCCPMRRRRRKELRNPEPRSQMMKAVEAQKVTMTKKKQRNTIQSGRI